MSAAELLILAAGLSMDAFAVSVCRGLAAGRADGAAMLSCGLWFGGAQALMPVIGFILGGLFAGAVAAVDQYVAAALLALIGGNMLREASSGEGCGSGGFSPGAMALLALATSVDALAAGISLAMTAGVRILPASGLIGVTTGLLSAAGVRFGSVFGERLGHKAQIAGGVMLLLLALRILIQHLGGTG